jgi:hypothetical protein
MAWNHPDDVPTSITKRVYEMDGPAVSENLYATVIADAYEAVKQEVLRDLQLDAAQNSRTLTRDNADEIAAWVGGWRAGGVRELVGWGLRNNVTYARPGDTIIRKSDGTFEIEKEPQQ